MSNEYVFIFKNNKEAESNNPGDRDCVVYTHREPRPTGLTLTGSCFSRGFDKNEKYEDMTTILTEKEWDTLVKFDKESIRYGKVSKRKTVPKAIKDIWKKLLSDENEALFEKVKEEEIEYMKAEYYLTDEDIEKIFDTYSLDYRDRSIVACVYDDAGDCGETEADSWFEIPEKVQQYFDYQKFGQDLADEDECYLELDNGKIVRLNY